MHYSEEEMLGKRVLVVANLKVRVVTVLIATVLSNLSFIFIITNNSTSLQHHLYHITICSRKT